MIRKLNKSIETFSEVEDDEERKILTNFSFICMLSFDIWVKKTIIENIIDHKMDIKPTRKKDRSVLLFKLHLFFCLQFKVLNLFWIDHRKVF